LTGLYTLSASLIWGVNTLFLLDAGLDILGVFIANASFSIGMAIFEIPTGVLADTRGRRTSFLLSIAILAFGTVAYLLVAQTGGNLTLFVIASVVMGLGYTFYSGAMEAWVVDALQATGYEDSLDNIFSRSATVSGAAMLIGTVSGGFIGNWDLAYPFIGRVLLLIMVFIFAFITMHDIGYEPKTLNLATLPAEMKKVARAGITFGWQQRPVRLLMLVSAIQAGFMAWGFYAWQPYFLDLLGQELIWVSGLMSALVALAMMVGNQVVNWFSKFCGKRTTLMLWATAVFTISSVGVGITDSFWPSSILFLLSMVALGVMGPVQQAFLHQLIPSAQRATIVSFNSMISSGFSVGSQSGLGWLAQNRSIASGYVTGGLVTLITFPILLLLRRLDNDADIIVGEAGKQGSCAAQGLPQIAHVETGTAVST
jgi:MFS family permease